MSQRIVRVFLNADLRCGHDGLAALAKKESIDVKKLPPGEYVIFLNAAKDRVKVYAASNVVAYHRSESGRLEMAAIARIPQAFTASGHLDYSKALRATLEQALAKKISAKAEK